MFLSFGIIEFILGHFENRGLSKPVWCGSGCGAVSHISLVVRSRLNLIEFAVLISLVHSLLPTDLTIQNLSIFTAADVVLLGGHKTFPSTSS